MSTRTWHKGTPPFPGWWNASWDFNNCLWRWWNGREWSLPAFDWDTAANVKFVAAESDPNQKLIEWTDVPRMVNINNHLSKTCEYSKHDKYADPGCVGCKHRFTPPPAAPIMSVSVTP